MSLQWAEAGSTPAEWRVVWLGRENGGAGFSGNWAGFAQDQVRLSLRRLLWIFKLTVLHNTLPATYCASWQVR